MTWALAYASVSFLIGVWWELEQGASWESSARRMVRMLGYAVAWPLLAGISLWFVWTLDPEDLL